MQITKSAILKVFRNKSFKCNNIEHYVYSNICCVIILERHDHDVGKQGNNVRRNTLRDPRLIRHTYSFVLENHYVRRNTLRDTRL